MLGCNLEPSLLMLGDNMAVVLNTTIPSSAIKKKHQACNYHKIREKIAAGFIQFAHIRSETNMADILTKPLGNIILHNLATKYLFRNAKTTMAKPSSDDKTGEVLAYLRIIFYMLKDKDKNQKK